MAFEQKSDPRTVTAERVIPASPAVIFDILRRPATHQALDASGMVQGQPDGPERLAPGDRFTMSMRQAGRGYRSRSTVVEFEQDRLLTWETIGLFRGRKIIGGQWWRYQLAADAEGTLVRHSYLWGKASLALLTIWLPGYPRRMSRTMPGTLERLAELVAEAR